MNIHVFEAVCHETVLATETRPSVHPFGIAQSLNLHLFVCEKKKSFAASSRRDKKTDLLCLSRSTQVRKPKEASNATGPMGRTRLSNLPGPDGRSRGCRGESAAIFIQLPSIRRRPGQYSVSTRAICNGNGNGLPFRCWSETLSNHAHFKNAKCVREVLRKCTHKVVLVVFSICSQSRHNTCPH